MGWSRCDLRTDQPLSRHLAEREVGFRGESDCGLVPQRGRLCGGPFSRRHLGTPVPLSSTGAGSAQLDIDSEGNALVVWGRFQSPQAFIEGTFRPAGGTWQPPVVIASSSNGTSYGPGLAFDPFGNVICYWSRWNNGSNEVYAAERLRGGPWSSAVGLSGPSADRPNFAFDSSGGAIMTWQRGSGSFGRTQAITRPAGGAWSTPVDLSPASHETYSAGPVFTAQGEAVVTWTERESDNSIWTAQARVRSVGGSWAPAETISTPGVSSWAGGPVATRQGDAFALLSANGDAQSATQAVRRTDGQWQAPVRLSPPWISPGEQRVAVDDQGNGFVSWVYTNSNYTGIVQGVGYDAAGPQFRDLSIPESGGQGNPVDFSASPLDVWSEPEGQPHWTFGDGGEAFGDEVTHTYAEQGSYDVTVSQSDTLGNASSASGTITMEPESRRRRHHRLRLRRRRHL